MRRNVIASVLLTTLMLASLGAMVYAQVTVQIGTPSSPNDLGITTSQGYWIGEFPITINANTGEAYCLTPSGTIYEGSSYTADEVSVPTDSPTWQAISYVLSWYAPTDATSAAIDQVAIWQLLGDNPPYADFTLDSSITTPASTLAANANGKNTAPPYNTLTWISPSTGTASANPGDAASFLVQLNSKSSNVQIDFTATLTLSGGSPTPLPSADVSPSMAFTDSDGMAQVSVTVPSDAPVGSAITVTAYTQSVWPTKYLDLLNYDSGAQNLIGVGPALDLTTSSTVSVPQSLTVLAPVTITSNEVNAGTVSQTSGSYGQNPTTIVATANPGYHFVDWVVTGGVSVTSNLESTTTFITSGTGGIEAFFAPNPTVSLVPSTNIDLSYPSTLPIGSTFTVAVNIANAANLWGYNFGMEWTPSIVECTHVAKGTFITQDGDPDASPLTTIDNVAGDTPGGFSDVLLDTSSFSGSGLLATSTFQVVGGGVGSIGLTSLELLDPSSSHLAEGYTNTIPSTIPLVNPTQPPSAPTASFTFTGTPATISGQYVTIPFTTSSTSLTFTSTSTGGFDSGQSVPINGYSWTITSAGGKFTTVTSTAATVTVPNVLAPDTVIVSLTVTASEASPPAGYAAIDTASTSQTLTIIHAAATGIDVYTQQGGVGANVPGGPFGPQQNVVATAYVFSNGSPVASKDVEFYVTNNQGQTFGSAVATTNEAGIASISFRLPTMDTGVEKGFGSNWNIQAIVDISQVQYVDNCKFTFGYLENIAPDVTETPSPVVRGTGSVTITAMITALPNNPTLLQGLQVTFTVVDSNNVPVAAADVVPTLSAGNTATVQVTLAIPNCAFTGGATVNVNVLTPLGDPYCPQNGETVAFNANGIYTGAIENAAGTVQISH